MNGNTQQTAIFVKLEKKMVVNRGKQQISIRTPVLGYLLVRFCRCVVDWKWKTLALCPVVFIERICWILEINLLFVFFWSCLTTKRSRRSHIPSATRAPSWVKGAHERRRKKERLDPVQSLLDRRKIWRVSFVWTDRVRRLRARAAAAKSAQKQRL